MKKVGLIILFYLIKMASFAQIPEHVKVDNDPVRFSDTASICVWVGIPVTMILLGFVWRKKRKINFEITACGNKQVFRKELKHMVQDQNIVKNRDLATNKEVFDN